ncbi:MAG TPA: hypothetical protein HA262_17390 [Methanosarcina sp.]|nr:hypothetical protein [Methanosarcina sp.]
MKKVGRNEERVVEPLSFREVVKETDLRFFNINRHPQVRIAGFEIHFEMCSLFAFTRY